MFLTREVVFLETPRKQYCKDNLFELVQAFDEGINHIFLAIDILFELIIFKDMFLRVYFSEKM